MSPFRVVTLILFAHAIDLARAGGRKLQIFPNGAVLNFPTNQGSYGSLITCQASGDDPSLFTDMKWINSLGEEIRSNDKFDVKVDIGKISLRFLNPSKDDSGNYTCRAKFQGVDEPEAKVHVSFYQDIVWEDCPLHQPLVNGEEGNIKCRVSAYPPAKIEWTKNGKPLSSERYNLETGGIRVKGAVNPEDEGVYAILATVETVGKYDGKEIRVSVYTPPKFDDMKDNVEAIEGQPTDIICQAVGVPKPQYSWFDQNKKNLSSEVGYIVNQDTGTLTIIKVQESNKGNFTCLAHNPAGKIEKSVTLSVLVKPSITFLNTTGVAGLEFGIECKARGIPTPLISIRHNGEKDVLISDARRTLLPIMVDDESKLMVTIKTLAKEDAGFYYCEADNKADKVIQPAYLTVEYPPDLSKTPTNIKTWGTHPVNLSCIADAVPPPSFTWTFRGQPINLAHSSFRLFSDIYGVSRLQVSPVSMVENIYGEYQCKAENNRGPNFVTISLGRAEPPSPPMNNDLKFFTRPTSVVIKLLQELNDNGKPIESYTVQYRSQDVFTEPMKALKFADPKTTEFEIRNLKPNTVYEIKIAAVNAVGEGDFSETFNVKTDPESVPDAPELDYGSQDGDNGRDHVPSEYADRYRVYWTPGGDNGKAILRYELKVCEVQENRLGTLDKCQDGETYQVAPKDGKMEYLVTSLKPSRYYRIEVKAVNDVGPSVPKFLNIKTAAANKLSPVDIDAKEPKASSSLTTVLLTIFLVLFVILIVMDVIFYIRCQVGALYFLRAHFCPTASMDSDSKLKGDDITGSRGDTVINEELTPMMANGAHGGKTDQNDEKPAVIPKDSAV